MMQGFKYPKRHGTQVNHVEIDIIRCICPSKLMYCALNQIGFSRLSRSDYQCVILGKIDSRHPLILFIRRIENAKPNLAKLFGGRCVRA